MSQPKEFGPNELDPLNEPLTNFQTMVKVFQDAERPKEEWLIGIEYEIFGQIDKGTKPLPFDGDVSIRSLFQRLYETSADGTDPYTRVFEDEHLIALTGKRAVIALEPGGQLEIAARPHHRLSDAISVFTELVREISDAAKKEGIQLFAMGVHPLARREDMAVVKKSRYAIMRQYMGALNGLGLDMMTRSCAIQINLDFSDESDMVKKTRLAAALVPFFSLLCASTGFMDGKPGKHAIERGHVWRKTDPDRTGIPKIIFDKDFGYESWINMVLDVPMYFIRRGHIYHNVAGASFRDFMAHGLNGHQATIRDFVDHLSTVFTEVRLKPILELRSTDSLPVMYTNALMALTWALFYDEQAFDRAQAIFDNLTYAELSDLHNDVINVGKDAQFRGQKVFSVANTLLEIAKDALLNLNGSEDHQLSKLLKPLSKLIEKNTTCAEWVKANFSTLDKTNLPDLISRFEPFNNPLA